MTIKRGDGRTGDSDNAVYGPSGTKVTVTATPKDDTFGLKSLTLDLMGTGSATALESGDSFTLGEANALVVATFASTGNGGSGGGTGGNGGDGDGTGTDTGDGAGDENDEGLQDGLNMDVEYNIKGLVLAAYAEWGANGGGKTFVQWLQASPGVLRAFVTNSLDNMAAAAKSRIPTRLRAWRPCCWQASMSTAAWTARMATSSARHSSATWIPAARPRSAPG